MVDGLGGDEQLRARSGRWCARRRSGREPHARAGSARADEHGWRFAARWGSNRTPSRRIFCRVIRAAADAPRSVKIFRASRNAASSGASYRASAASYGQPRPVHSRAAASPVARRLQPVGLGESPRGGRREPVRRSQAATAPRSQASHGVQTSSASSASRCGRARLALQPVRLGTGQPRAQDGPAARRSRRRPQPLSSGRSHAAGRALPRPTVAKAGERIDPVDR